MSFSLFSSINDERGFQHQRVMLRMMICECPLGKSVKISFTHKPDWIRITSSSLSGAPGALFSGDTHTRARARERERDTDRQREEKDLASSTGRGVNNECNVVR